MIVHRSCFPFLAVVLVACGSSSSGTAPSAAAGGASANAGGSSGSSASTGGTSAGGAGTAGAGGGASGGACGALEACCSAPDYPDKSCAPTAHMLAMQNGEATCAALLQTVQAKGLCSGSVGAGGMGAGGTGAGGTGAGGVSAGGTSSGGGTGGVTQSATCMTEAKGFVACGGDPTGTWKIVNVCSPVGTANYGISCAVQLKTGKQTFWFDGGSGTYAFAGGTLTETDFSASYYIIDDTTKSCLANPDCGAFCKSLEQGGKMVASDDGTTCHCEGYTLGPKPTTASAPYSISGTQMDLGGAKVDFCISGTTLRLAMPLTGPGKQIVVAEKM